MKTLVLGLGNPILSDDGIGLLVAASLKKRFSFPGLTIIESELGGLNLLELLSGYDKAVIVDAIQTREGIPGSIYEFGPQSLMGGRHSNSTHGINFGSTIELGRRLGLDLPGEITIFAVEVKDVTSFSNGCSPEVAKAIPECVGRISEAILGRASLSFNKG
jgi:hydrogenase maturation protease